MRLKEFGRISYVFLNYCPHQFTISTKHDTIQSELQKREQIYDNSSNFIEERYDN